MTINYPLGIVECECLWMGKQKLIVDWVSHGNYGLQLGPGEYIHSLLKPAQNPVEQKPPEMIKFGDIEIPNKIEIEVKPSQVPDCYMTLEKEHFPQIIQAYYSNIKSNDIFESMWKGIVPPRGMHIWQTRLFAYRNNRCGEWLTLHSQTFFDIPCDKITSLTIKIENFEEAWKIIEKATDSQTPFHCCVFG